MSTKFFSLIKPLIVCSGRKFIKYVSPPLVGVVCLFISAIDVHAYDAKKDIDMVMELSIPRHYASVPIYTKNESLWQYGNDEHAGESCLIDLRDLTLTVPSQFWSSYSVSGASRESTNLLNLAYIKVHLLVNGKEYVIDMNRIENHVAFDDPYESDWREIDYVDIYRFSGASNRPVYVYADLLGSGRINILCYIEFVSSDDFYVYKSYSSSATTLDEKTYNSYELPIWLTTSLTITIGESGVSSLDYDNATIDAIQRNTDQDESFHQQDFNDATQAGSDMTGLASDLENLQNAWAILWYPIQFTNRFVQVFVGGTQSAIYEDEYQYVTGYRYNDDTGFLEPIMARTAQPVSAGTGITFPAFELMGMTIWDSYTYDLSSLTSQFPVIFDSLYVIVSILEMLWFVSYLRNKYEEVFG